MNNPVDIQLKNIHDKLQQLLKEYRLVQKENTQLKKDLEKQKLLSITKSEQIQSLQQKIDAMQVGISNWGERDKKIMEKRIDTYLKEIEKCLSLLNAE